MVNAHLVSTIIHEIHELDGAIERFSSDADARSNELSFDLQAIIQWGRELAQLIAEVESLPERSVPLHRSKDPLYERALTRARAVHDDATSAEHELTVCLDAISAIDDGPALWAGLLHLQSELEALEDLLSRFAQDLQASVGEPTDS